MYRYNVNPEARSFEKENPEARRMYNFNTRPAQQMKTSGLVEENYSCSQINKRRMTDVYGGRKSMGWWIG